MRRASHRFVPTFKHELFVELFRNDATLAFQLLHACAGIELRGDTIEHGSIDLSLIAPVEYRSDTVSIVRDADRRAIGAAIVEIQLAIDPDKRRSWPVYIAGLHAKLGCPVFLLVVAPEPATARWAQRTIELGQPGFALRPIVLDYRAIPRVTDAEVARRHPELAVLSSIAHPELAVAAPTIDAIADLHDDRDRKSVV